MRHLIGVMLLALVAPLIGCDKAADPTPVERTASAAPATGPPPVAQPAAAPPAAASTPAAPTDRPPAPRPVTEAFDAVGVVVSVNDFFDAAKNADAGELVAAGVADKALVTAAGVYAFIETPGNLQQLSAISAGTPVHMSGMVHHPGRLLHIDHIHAARGVNVPLKKFAAAPATTTTLTGKNKCQCGIKIAQLHTSCKLGHLHHLEADDGKIYHYLQTAAAGRDAIKGAGSHFKSVAVTGAVLPGQFILVESVTVQ